MTKRQRKYSNSRHEFILLLYPHNLPVPTCYVLSLQLKHTVLQFVNFEKMRTSAKKKCGSYSNFKKLSHMYASPGRRTWGGRGDDRHPKNLRSFEVRHPKDSDHAPELLQRFDIN